MSGSITFVGAGPGAPDLITLRGAAALRDADLVIYAGSLVNEELLELAPKARLVNSAKLALPEVLREMRQAYEQGENVVRLHTGDPAIYGAVSEQFRELDRLGIPYSVVPGVSSAFAAAAALKVELTMPGLSQSVILTRDAGRTPVPEKEALDQLAAHGSTMCIFLSVGEMESLIKKLLSAGRSPSTPAAVVYRASWPNEQIVRGTLADIAARLHQPPYAVSRLLSCHTGQNFRQLLQQRKLQQAAYLLSHTPLPVEAILENIGYENSSYFYRRFRERYGCSPADYRRQQTAPRLKPDKPDKG